MTIDKPVLTSDVAEEILELARVAAHTQERRFAPLVSFVAGLAIDRLGQDGEPLGSDAAAQLIREVRTELEGKSTAER